MRLASRIRVGLATAAFGALLIGVPLAPTRAADTGCAAGTATDMAAPGTAAADNRDWQQRGTSGTSQGAVSEDPDAKRPGSSTRAFSSGGDADNGGQILSAKPGAKPQIALAVPNCK